MAAEVAQKIVDIICEVKDGELTPDDVTPEKSFKNDLQFDSLDQASLVMKIEDKFEDEGLGSIPQEEADELETVGAVIEYIQGKLKQTA